MVLSIRIPDFYNLKFLIVTFQYTGDFRFENIGLGTLNSLHDNDGRVLKLDELYLDTTFCSRSYLHFPHRDDALQVSLSGSKSTNCCDYMNKLSGKSLRLKFASFGPLRRCVTPYPGQAQLKNVELII